MKKYIILIPIYNDRESLKKLIENINQEISIWLSKVYNQLNELKNKMLESAKLAGSASRPSFGQDVLKKRRTEVDFLTGYISKIGKKNNVKTPVCDRITEIVNNLGVGFDPSPNHLDEIEKMINW